MSVKMNLKFKPKNHAADPEIQFLTKLILRPYGRAAFMPTALELMINSSKIKWKNNLSNWRRLDRDLIWSHAAIVEGSNISIR